MGQDFLEIYPYKDWQKNDLLVNESNEIAYTQHSRKFSLCYITVKKCKFTTKQIGSLKDFY